MLPDRNSQLYLKHLFQMPKSQTNNKRLLYSPDKLACCSPWVGCCGTNFRLDAVRDDTSIIFLSGFIHCRVNCSIISPYRTLELASMDSLIVPGPFCKTSAVALHQLLHVVSENQQLSLGTDAVAAVETKQGCQYRAQWQQLSVILISKWI